MRQRIHPFFLCVRFPLPVLCFAYTLWHIVVICGIVLFMLGGDRSFFVLMFVVGGMNRLFCCTVVFLFSNWRYFVIFWYFWLFFGFVFYLFLFCLAATSRASILFSCIWCFCAAILLSGVLFWYFLLLFWSFCSGLFCFGLLVRVFFFRYFGSGALFW